MPRLTIETPHGLGEEEALRRLKAKLGDLKDTYQNQFRDLREEWNGSTLSFGFKTAGMKVAGMVSAESSQVKIDAELPLAAMIVKGMIETRVKQELGSLLA